jgi:hypothetical protein
MNFGKQFEEFYTTISIDSSKRNALLSNKKALRDRIRGDFKAKGRTLPLFYIQGSMDRDVSTGINPLNSAYDIDDGIYLQNIDTSGSTEDWTTPATVHKWIVDAVDGHTGEDVQDKAKCVRVPYAKNEKHVDFPIYAQKDDDYYLAIKGKGWIKNHPKKISVWFRDERASKGEEFRKCVRLLKAWKDYRESQNGQLKLFGGFQLAVLTSKHYPISYENLEELYFRLVENIKNNLWAIKPLKNPIDHAQDIIEGYSDSRIQKFKDEFTTMYENAKAAYESEDCDEKHKQWKKVFGDRFPKPVEKDCEDSKNVVENALKITGIADISKTSGRQA